VGEFIADGGLDKLCVSDEFEGDCRKCESGSKWVADVSCVKGEALCSAERGTGLGLGGSSILSLRAGDWLPSRSMRESKVSDRCGAPGMGGIWLV
jgi:hypothetical protein